MTQPADADPSPGREVWSRRSVFILAAIGSAVGLGNIWRFPYVAYSNGGGAFMIPYLVALLTAGIPLLFLYYSIGHRFKGSPPLAFRRMSKRAEGLGWWQVGICFIIAVYYAVIIAWAARFAIFSAKGDLSSPEKAGDAFGNLTKSDQTSLGFDYVAGVAWPLLITWVVVIAILAFGVQKGIGATAQFFVPVLVVLFIAVVIRALLLDGAGEGLNSLFTPDWGALTDSSVWIAAYGQIFFSLSVGFGIMITYSSYLKRKTNLTGAGLVVGFSNSAFEILAGIGVFAALGYMAAVQGVPVVDVADSGIGLAFVAFPTIISTMWGGSVFGLLFFISLIFAGITSLVSIIEVIISAVRDKTGMRRVPATILVGAAATIVSMVFFPTRSGVSVLDTVDHFANEFGIVGAALTSVVVVTWLLRKLPQQRDHLNGVSSFKLGWIWMACVGVITPIVLAYMLIDQIIDTVQNGYGDYGGGLVAGFGWALQIALIVIAVAVGFTRWHKSADQVIESDDAVAVRS
ncbi:sodium-dependent transporter [Tomitella fengzijianii]|uniref:Transporter n=1 Tax=Tomitella fengzijianii TaxID=2597660 RepID=A0A516X411_9ACTN|nr:sodium-dependent transporter [Tomitella fengzijianii]QDQ97808.1 sodium-dependent transporter [Tomitella fengzijianii]